MRFFCSVMVLGLLAVPAWAITVDGVLDSDYGPALAVQTVQTQFGDEGAGCDDCGGELDAAYAKISNGRLYLMITGNLEADSFNKLELFVDSKAGGENVLSNVPQYDFMSGVGYWNSQNLGGLTFDAALSADYHLFARGGFGNFEVDFVNRMGGGSAQVPGAKGSSAMAGGAGAQTAAGVIPAGTLGPNASSSSLVQSLVYGFNNTNNAGVIGGTGAADMAAAAAVTTGVEFSIALRDLGSPAPGTELRIGAYYGNGDHNYFSNQSLAGLPAGTGNLGGDNGGGFIGTSSGVNYAAFAGEQFFRLTVPEPSTLALFALALVGFVGGRRR